MKIQTILLLLVFFTTTAFAQKMTDYNFGKPFSISYPPDYSKVYDLNEVAAAQFSNEKLGKYSIVIQTEKENLKFANVTYTSIINAGQSFANNLKTGLVDDANLKLSDTKEITINNYKASESTVQGTYSSGEMGTSADLFYYLVVVETQNYYYQILLWCNKADKDKYLEEFRKIAKTFKESK